MLPSDQRLLTGAREALIAAMEAEPSSKSAAILVSAKAALDELVLRNDAEFFSGYLSEGFKLLQDGAVLSGERVETEGARLAGDADAGTKAPMDELRRALADLVTELAPRESTDKSVSAFLVRVVDWENVLYGLRSRASLGLQHGERVPPGPFTVEAVERYLRERFPNRSNPQVSCLNKLTGGFSKSTVMFDVEDTSTPRRTLVIRAEQPMSLVFLEGAKIENEYLVLCLARAAGIPVAEPLWLEADPKHFGVKFLVSDKAVGRNVGTPVGLTEAFSDTLLKDLVRNLFRIHQTTVRTQDTNVRNSHLGRWLQFRTLTESNRQNVAYWRETIALMDLPASPIVARALDWLTRNIPECEDAPSLVHRDYGAHNILVENERISCILDWESASIGDPAEDLAWMTHSMKGQVERQRVLDLYAEISGRPVPIERIRFFDVLTGLKYAVTCTQALSIFDRQPAAPVSLCNLGLLYMHHGTGELNRQIEIAEQGYPSS